MHCLQCIHETMTSVFQESSLTNTILDKLLVHRNISRQNLSPSHSAATGFRGGLTLWAMGPITLVGGPLRAVSLFKPDLKRPELPRKKHVPVGPICSQSPPSLLVLQNYKLFCNFKVYCRLP